MKARKSIGALALSAALVVGGAMPAFATPTDTTGADGKYQDWSVTKDVDDEGNMIAQEIEDGADGASSTPVYIDVKKSNINVAVPLELRFVAETAGGELLCPSDGVYGVWNYSMNTAVYVNKVEVSYNEDANRDGENWLLTTDDTKVGSGVEADTANLGNIMVKLVAPDATGGADSYVLDTENAKVPTRAAAWRIEKSNTATNDDGTYATGRAFPLNFEKASCLSSIVQDADAANLMSQGNGADKAAANAIRLKYTISTARPVA